MLKYTVYTKDSILTASDNLDFCKTVCRSHRNDWNVNTYIRDNRTGKLVYSAERV